MKKLVFIIVIITVFLWNTVIAQWQVQPTIGISYSLSLFGSYKTEKIASISNYSYNQLYHTVDIVYHNIDIKGGVILKKSNHSISIMGSYNYFFSRDKFIIYQEMYTKKFIMQSHFLGLTITNKFRETKIVRPFVSLELSTEISTNYKDKYLNAPDYYPVPPYLSSIVAFNANVNYYKSTPFIGNLLVGCDFRLYKELSVNTAFGYGLRILKAQYGTLYYHPSVQNKPATETKIGNPYTLGFNMLTLQLGINYTFSFKKKTKTEMP